MESGAAYWFGRTERGVRLWPVSWPNLVTAARLTIAVFLGAAGLATAEIKLLLGAYAVYWVGDMLDGFVARLLDDETRFGAVLDILADRASTALLASGLLLYRPDAWPAIAVFLIQFMVLDTMLSLSFLRWQLISPNYFHMVDPLVWRWNWSPVAKGINTASVAIAVVLGANLLALALAVCVLLVKAFSAVRVLERGDASTARHDEARSGASVT